MVYSLPLPITGDNLPQQLRTKPIEQVLGKSKQVRLESNRLREKAEIGAWIHPYSQQVGLFRLADLGYLLISTPHAWGFKEKELGQLVDVVQQFASALHYGLVLQQVAQENLKRKASEAAARHALLRAERISQHKTRFLASMSHDIRTPLNAMMGFAELLESENDFAQRQRYVRMMLSSGALLNRLLSDVLDLNKLEAGKLDLQPKPVALLPEIENCLEPYFYLAAQQNLELCLNWDPAIPNVLVADSSRLQQVLINLVTNAMKFTKQGQVCIEVKLLNRIKNECLLQFTVADTGPGIPIAEQARIFTPFSQVSASEGGVPSEGHGLGLAIVAGILKMLGGKIELQSPSLLFADLTDVVGTDFRFTVPLQTACPNTQTLEPAAQLLANADLNLDTQASILLVEDNAVNQMLFYELLTSQGLKVDMLETGEAALAQLSELGKYALILMDINLGGELDGYATTRAIRESYSHEQLPIIAVTANAYPEDPLLGEAAGMNDYLTKPITRSLILEKIRPYVQAPLPSQHPV
jgi:signal transduction histidine kinase/ActR/RegA family two-component response regulator